MLLSAALVFMCAPTGSAAKAQLSASLTQGSYAEQPRLIEAGFQEHAAALERAQTVSHTEGFDPNASVAPRVDVRVDDHGEFERVVFEWPAAIDYDVVQHADQVTIAFSRSGRIDLSRLTNHLGRLVLDAWAENADATTQVTLRLVPNARVRSLDLKDGRVAIDLFVGTAAQSLASPAPDPDHDTIEGLRRALEQRDAVIDDLLARFEQLTARFEQLERTVALSSGDLDRVTAGQTGPMPWVGQAPRPEARSPSVAAVEAPADRPTPEPPATPEQQSAKTVQEPHDPESAGAPASQDTAQGQAPAPGRVEVDEEAAERALDFTLVEEGALLLPLGRAQVTPSFTYTRDETGDFPVVVDPGGANLLGEQEVRRNEFEFAANLLVGLPLDSQLELGLPYNLVDQSIVTKVSGSEVQESSRTGQGLGDFSVGLAKTVLRERNWLPDVVLRVNWDTGTGERQNSDVFLDAGFQELTGSVSLIKRQDPLVFVGGSFYEWAYDEEDNIDPGDSYGFSIGTFLAASPNTSLSVVLNQSFGDEVEVAGQRIRGSDSVQSILSFGASAILGRNWLLNGAVGVGLTDDSPDYSVSLSLPIRFSTPGL